MNKKYNWAEHECRIACKRENPDFDFDNENDWDYGCSCYKSALKAYNSLNESLGKDGHSGYSFNVTKNILIRLIDGLPLTPITDDDFDLKQFGIERGTEEYPAEHPAYLKEMGLKDNIQCPRKTSLFKQIALDGTVSYKDIDRAYYANIENPSDTYSSSLQFLDEMFPITMPYMPKKEKYVIYTQTFLTDKKHGDFDTRGILYVITPDGKKVDVNIFETEGDDSKWKRITKDEYDKLLEKRIDKLNEKIASSLIWTLISNSGSDKEIKYKEEKYDKLSKETKDKYFNDLSLKCEFFNNPDNWKYNTFSIHQALCTNNEKKYKDIPELKEIADYLKMILEKLDDVTSKPNMTLLEEVKNYLENASPEQLEKDWQFVAQFDNCGPLAKDFIQNK